MDSNTVTSEAIALNCAVASGIVAEFMEDEDLIATVSGRMSSGTFDLNIANSKSSIPCHIEVNNSQIETDDAYEGRGLALLEAKRDLSDDFLLDNFDYPYRVFYCVGVNTHWFDYCNNPHFANKALAHMRTLSRI